VTAEFVNLPQFAAMCDEMARLTGRERAAIVRNVARDFCFAALRRTPMADKIRKGGNLEHWVVLHHRYTGQVVVFPGTAEQQAKYGRSWWRSGQTVPNRGFAKAGWIGCLRKLGVGPAAPGDASPAKRTGEQLYNEVLSVDLADEASVEVANQTPPIVPLDGGGPHNPPHNIAALSLQDALQKMEAALVKLRERQEQAWGAVA